MKKFFALIFILATLVSCGSDGGGKEKDPCEDIYCNSYQYCYDGYCSNYSGRCTYSYECPDGYTCDSSNYCVSEGNPCEDVTCSYHGTCVNNNGTAVCNCENGYHREGLDCVQDSGVCANADCSSVPNSHCEDVMGSATCVCDTGYVLNTAGNACVEENTNPCLNELCSNHGTCVNNNGTAVCNCENGYHAEGLSCVEDAAICDGFQCPEHSHCIDFEGEATCVCDDGYYLNSDATACVEPPACTDDNIPNTVGSARAITIPYNQTHHSCTGKDDYFKLNLTAGIPITVTITFPTGDIDIYLQDIDGGSFAYSNGIDQIETFTYTPSTSDTYYLSVNPYNVVDTNYLLTVTTDTVECSPACDSWKSCIDGICVLNEGSCDSNADCEIDYICDIYAHKCNTLMRQWGTIYYDKGNSVAVDSSGNVFVTGFTQGGLDGNTNANVNDLSPDIFLTKFDNAGNKFWTKQWGTTSEESGQSVAVDSSGNVFVTGYTSGGLDGNTSAGLHDIFLTKFDNAGNKQWTKQWGTTYDDEGASVAVDSNGNVFVTGSTCNSYAHECDILLIKWNNIGVIQWIKQWGTDDSEGINAGYSVAVDSSGNVFVTGFTQGGLDGNTLLGSSDIFLTKFDNIGNKLWTKEWGTVERDEGNSVAIDSSGNIFVTGYNRSNIVNRYDTDIFLTKLDTTGNILFTKQWGTIYDDNGASVVVGSSGNVFVTGSTGGGLDGNIDVDGLTIDDIFLTKFDNNGNKQWTNQWGTIYDDKGASVVVGNSGNVFVTGSIFLDNSETESYGYDIFLIKYTE